MSVENVYNFIGMIIAYLFIIFVVSFPFEYADKKRMSRLADKINLDEIQPYHIEDDMTSYDIEDSSYWD